MKFLASRRSRYFSVATGGFYDMRRDSVSVTALNVSCDAT